MGYLEVDWVETVAMCLSEEWQQVFSDKIFFKVEKDKIFLKGGVKGDTMNLNERVTKYVIQWRVIQCV